MTLFFLKVLENLIGGSLRKWVVWNIIPTVTMLWEDFSKYFLHVLFKLWAESVLNCFLRTYFVFLIQYTVSLQSTRHSMINSWTLLFSRQNETRSHACALLLLVILVPISSHSKGWFTRYDLVAYEKVTTSFRQLAYDCRVLCVLSLVVGLS